MTVRRILTLVCAAFVLVEARWHDIQKRDVTSICDAFYNNTYKVQCYCVKDIREGNTIKSADCYLTKDDVTPDDLIWDYFNILKNTHKITLTNSKRIVLKYIPTNAFKHTTELLKLDIKYGNIEKVQPFAFANLSSIEEITLSDNQIQVLESHAFAHHRDLTVINLDKNNIEEINRDVFIDLPSLEKMFLASNKITTIHDRAFIHLFNLRELEINLNSIFSLNNETFSGLKKLQKLDLSSNALEVIGDDTFLPLGDLKTLNLAGNKIQMLDNKAFYGLYKLQQLSLAHNKLSDMDLGAFEGLNTLTSLSLRGNDIKELKPEVMAPILNNLYDIVASLDVEDNNFACDCRLDWFMSLMNQTQSKNLQMAMENLKCLPDTKLKETWNKIEENDRNSGQVFDNGENQPQTQDYEYYDESQLNGKLFYIDVRFLLNCTGPNYTITPQLKTTVKPVTEVNIPKTTNTKVSSPTTNKPTTKSVLASNNLDRTTERVTTRVTNQGLLDLSVYDTTVKASVVTNDAKAEVDKKPNLYTTSRLATVSAKPYEHKSMYEEGMASDEAKPDKQKTHRSVHEEYKDIKENSATRNLGCVMLILLNVRLLY